jgi:Rod binding domain-containing protein
MAMDPPAPVVPPLPPLAGTASRQGTDAASRARGTARQFEAMFMTEMLRQARPQSQARGRFAQGEAEKSWQVFMDQALGEAAAARGGTGLSREIERALGVPDAKPRTSRTAPR